MTTVIRAKFRCLSVMHTWEETTVVKLGPVKRDGKDDENRVFWKYTPSGEIELTFGRGKTAPFKPGEYFYVDMERRDGGAWSINGIEQNPYTTTVTMSPKRDEESGLQWGSLKLCLSSEAQVARDVLQPLGSTWAIAFAFAEPSDASGLYS